MSFALFSTGFIVVLQEGLENPTEVLCGGAGGFAAGERFRLQCPDPR